VRALERSIVHYGDTTPFVAERMREEGMGYASAVGFALFVIIFVLTLLQFRAFGKPVEG